MTAQQILIAQDGLGHAKDLLNNGCKLFNNQKSTILKHLFLRLFW